MPELSSLSPPLPPPPEEVSLVERVRSWSRPAQVVAAAAAFAVAALTWLFVENRRALPPPPELSMARATPASAEAQPTEDAHVHVAGAVARPGVYRVPFEARVTAVLDAAGGATPEADLDQLNLAARAHDGERIYVPRRGEMPPPGPSATSAAATGPLDLNGATLDQLETLPGVGPSTARAILEERRRRGRFRSVEELLDVRGIGEARLAQIRPKVRV